MSGTDDPRPDDAAAPRAGDAPGRRSSAAAAASRARRIGGRVAGANARPEARPAPRPSPGPTPAPSPAPSSPPERRASPSAAQVSVTKTAERGPAPRPPAPRPPAALPAWLRWLPAGVLSAGAAAMIVLLVVFSHGVWWAKPSGDALRERVLAAAKTCVAKTNTYTYNQLDKYRKQVGSCTTGALTGQIDKTIDSLLKKYGPTLKAKQTAQINRGGIEAVSQNGKQWTLLIFGQLSVTNTNYPSGRTDPFAAQVRMEKVHGRWLMSDLQTVSTPVS